jgi:phosphatidylglycerophosphatase A
MNGLARAWATWFGCGLAPIAPGTFGSAGAFVIIPLWLWMGWPAWTLAIVAAVLTPLSIWSATLTAKSAGRKDPGLVVVDEVLGQWVTLAGAPVLDWKYLLAGFFLFRILDIIKPFPARQFEALPDGMGIVADDLMAGVYGALALWAAGRYFS